MNRTPEKPDGVWRGRTVSWPRMFLALGIAMAADLLQLALNIPGWAGPDQVIDVVTMLLVIPLIGFHWLLLPSFVLEFIPLAEDLPTWTGCVLAVIIIRRRQSKAINSAVAVGQPPATPPVISPGSRLKNH